MVIKKILFVVAAIFTLVSISAQSKLIDGSVKSKILGVEKPYSIYLPDGYETSGKDYPVLYLLHGAWGMHRDWIEKGNMREIADEAIASGMALPMIIVMPDARGEDANFAGKNQGYFNQPNWDYEDFFFKEFIPYIEKNYRIIADKRHRSISGLSMGGRGTTGYAQQHPEMFSSACPMSGAFSQSATQKIAPLEFIRTATPEQVEALKAIRWFVDCGDDDSLIGSNLEFYKLMHEKKIPVELRIRNGGHNWEFWRTSLTPVLTFVSIGFSM